VTVVNLSEFAGVLAAGFIGAAVAGMTLVRLWDFAKALIR